MLVYLSLFMFYNSISISQVHAISQDFTITISTSDNLIKSENLKFSLDVSVENNTNQNFILYGFGIVKEGFFADSVYNKNATGCGNVLFLSSPHGEQQHPSFEAIEETGLDTIKLIVSNLFQKEISNIKDTKLVMLNNTKQCTRLNFDLSSYYLDKGKYELYIMYYSGILNGIDGDYISNDIKNSNAIQFFGWIKSNLILIEII